MKTKPLISLALVLLLVGVTTAEAAEPRAADDSAAGAGPLPPRLSYVDGEVSFLRPGAPDWTVAQINTPLAAGDELYSGGNGTMELQVGGRAFARAWANTQLGIENHESDFLQLKVTSGHASLDLRALEPGRTVELDTPHAAFTIERAGYYRIDVTPERTQFITRRGGQVTMSVLGGALSSVAPSEEVVVDGGNPPRVEAFVAPDLDSWDRWNYARTDQLIDSVSSRYVSTGVYGVDDLDHYGTWRVVQTYGSVWVPDAVPSGWAPYTTGSWIWDPFYGWTWVDTAAWGWAPYHYGRWVFVNGFWAWSPGPVIVRPVYAPALVVFFGSPGIRVATGPVVGWCALGWGEPVIPWWGRSGFVGRPWWGGWNGPRVVNNVVVNKTTVVNVQNINVYRNASVPNAVVVVDQNHFGRKPVQEVRVARTDQQALTPVHGQLQVKPDPTSFVAKVERSVKPPKDVFDQRVVATRAPQRAQATVQTERGATDVAQPPSPAPAPRLVSVPKSRNQAVEPTRPPFGQSPVERQRPPLPPRATDIQRQSATPPVTASPGPPASGRQAEPPTATPPVPAPAAPAPTAPAPSAPVPHGQREPREQARPEPARPEPREQPRPEQPKPEQRVVTPAPAPPVVRPAPPEQKREQARPEPRPTAPAPLPQVPPSQGTRPAQREVRPEQARPEGRPAPQQPAPPGQPPRDLPGEPANRVYPGRSERKPDRPQPTVQRPAAPAQPAEGGRNVAAPPRPPQPKERAQPNPARNEPQGNTHGNPRSAPTAREQQGGGPKS